MQCCLVLRRGLAFFLSAIITCCLSPFLAFLFYLHVGSAHERPEIQPECSCECWDGLFKGTFGRGRYKSVYFNMEKTTALLLVLLAVVTVTVVKGATKVTRLAVTGKLRWRLFALLIPTTYLYLLSFWSAFDAINDRFYSSGLLYVAVFLLLLVFSTFIYMHLSESEPSPVLSSFSSSLHLSSFSSFLSFCTPVLTACALVLIAGYLLYLDTSTFRPAKYAYTIPTPCSCSCWDGVFKGRREKGGAKSVYFNVEATTTVLLTLVTCMLIAGNSFVVKAVKSIQAKALRTPLLFAVISTIFPIFYGFWALFNYYNDRIFHLLHSQVYFFLSEVVVACIACAQMSKEDKLNPFLLWFGFSIDAVHLIQSMMDQFIANVLFGKGERHQVSRDIGLLLGNVGAMICIGGALVGYYRNAPPPSTHTGAGRIVDMQWLGTHSGDLCVGGTADEPPPCHSILDVSLLSLAALSHRILYFKHVAHYYMKKCDCRYFIDAIDTVVTRPLASFKLTALKSEVFKSLRFLFQGRVVRLVIT